MKRLIAAAPLLLLPLTLSACIPAVPDLPNVSDAFDEYYLEGAEGIRDELAVWAADFESAGCSPETAGTDVTCSSALAAGGLLALTAQILLEGGGLDDSVRGDLDAAWQASKTAAASSTALSDAGCPGETTSECAPLATEAARDILTLESELSRWHR
jgi:hypothetical protein